MAETNGNGKDSLGVQAYRWIVGLGIAAIAGLSVKVLNDIEKTATKVDSLGERFVEARSTTDARLNAHTELFRSLAERWKQQFDRDLAQDSKIDQLRDRLWSMPATVAPAPVPRLVEPPAAPRDPITVYPPGR